MTSRDWSNLPGNAIYQIAISLSDLESKDCVRMVCKNWYTEVNVILQQIDERKKNFFQAELALMSMRYKDSFDIIQTICKENCDLSQRERDILFRCYYKVLIGIRKRRAGLAQIEEENDLLMGERIKVETELAEVCHSFTDLVDSYLLPAAKEAEAVVFYKRMKGQLLYYLAEMKVGEERLQLAEQCRIIYKEALDTASTELSPINKEMILLQSSRCLLHFKILNDVERARKWARQTVGRMSSINWLDWTDFDEGTSLFMFAFACDNDAGTFGDDVAKQDQIFYTDETRSLMEKIRNRRKSI